jgi:hypothetical protein
MDEFQLRNRVHELKSLIASDWPSIEERKQMYKELAQLERELESLNT